jgi:hypothetical protein
VLYRVDGKRYCKQCIPDAPAGKVWVTVDSNAPNFEVFDVKLADDYNLSALHDQLAEYEGRRNPKAIT